MARKDDDDDGPFGGGGGGRSSGQRKGSGGKKSGWDDEDEGAEAWPRVTPAKSRYTEGSSCGGFRRMQMSSNTLTVCMLMSLNNQLTKGS